MPIRSSVKASTKNKQAARAGRTLTLVTPGAAPVGANGSCIICSGTRYVANEICSYCLRRLKAFKASEEGSNDKRIFDIVGEKRDSRRDLMVHQLAQVRQRGQDELKLSINAAKRDNRVLKQKIRRLEVIADQRRRNGFKSGKILSKRNSTQNSN